MRARRESHRAPNRRHFLMKCEGSAATSLSVTSLLRRSRRAGYGNLDTSGAVGAEQALHRLFYIVVRDVAIGA